MPNLIDFMTWRGDLPFAAVPPCEIDYLLFAEISYVAFGELVPRDCFTLGEAAAALLERDPDAALIAQTPYLWKENRALLEKIVGSGRYGSLIIRDRVDEMTSDMQFSAVTFYPENCGAVVAFRGTDASFTGWEEDFLMALDEPVPAQKRAVQYVCDVAAKTTGAIDIVGHSKGGNLAIYSAATCGETVQARVRSIHNFDGPGFPHGLIESDGYRRVRGKLRVYQPQGSVIGMLLEHEKAFATVQAKSLGLMQHNAFNWQLSGNAFLRAEKRTQTSSFVSEVVHDWLEKLDNAQRAEFVEAVFSVVRALDVDSVGDLNVRLVTKLPAIIGRMASIPGELKSQLFSSLLKLGGTAVSALVQPVVDRLSGQKTGEDGGDEGKNGDGRGVLLS